tara:strand:- start:57 stop:968 length:912 start_codon:yes stop_codon:yes gene_type:complete
MLPDNFDFAQLPTGSAEYSLKEIGMLSSTIEDIDYAIVSWLKDDLNLSARSNQGFKSVPVLWQAPERAYQVKHRAELRDANDGIILPVVSIERTNITKDPAKKGSYQANRYSGDKDGRAGRFVIAKRIVPDKTRNFAVVGNTRTSNYTSGVSQRYYPRINKKVVIQTLSIPIPVYVSLDYKILIKTEYQQQMNDLMAPFMTRTGQINAFVMKRNGHTYESFIQQGFTHNNNVASLGEDARLFTTEITISVLGYLIGEGINDDRQLVRIDENTVEYQFPQESTVPTGNFNLWGQQKKKTSGTKY